MKIKRVNEMAEQREKIRLRDICDDNRLDRGLFFGWKNIEDNECDFDAEKGFIDHECVIQRESDGKYFKFTYTQFGYNGSDLLEQTAEEVKRKEKTIYYYV